MKKVFVMCMITIIVLIMAGCKATGSKEDPVQQENKKLSFGTIGGVPEELQTTIRNAFPNYDVTYVNLSYDQIESLYEEKNLPDIILDADSVTIPPHLRNKINVDLTPYVEMKHMDLNRFVPSIMARNYGQNGELYALPFQRYLSALFYNKAAFDAFGIPYPSDGMTWDDAIQLASRFSDSPNGAQYRGLDLINGGGLLMLLDQHKVTLLDPKTDQFKSSPELIEVAQKIRRIYEVPGNKPSEEAPVELNGFVKDGTTAMFLGYQATPILQGAANNQDIDVVTLPRIDASSNMGAGSRADSLLITSESKEKESAFEIIEYLVSDEMQKKNVENAIGTVINNPPYLNDFGKYVAQLQQKNIKALYEMDAPVLTIPSKYEWVAFQAAIPFLNELILSTKPVDDVLAEMESSVNDAVIAAKSKVEE